MILVLPLQKSKLQLKSKYAINANEKEKEHNQKRNFCTPYHTQCLIMQQEKRQFYDLKGPTIQYLYMNHTGGWYNFFCSFRLQLFGHVKEPPGQV